MLRDHYLKTAAATILVFAKLLLFLECNLYPHFIPETKYIFSNFRVRRFQRFIYFYINLFKHLLQIEALLSSKLEFFAKQVKNLLTIKVHGIILSVVHLFPLVTIYTSKNILIN